MLPETSKKELISQYLVLSMAAMAGIKAAIDPLDHGVDLTLKEVKKFIHKDKVRYMNSGKAIDLQLKCTTDKSVSIKNGAVEFNLEVKNFNDLVLRQRKKEIIPMFLLVVILPENPELWYESSFEKLILSAKRLWFRPEKGTTLSQNKQKVSIKIPVEQTATPKFFASVFEHFLP
jgi:hypothetical protein